MDDKLKLLSQKKQQLAALRPLPKQLQQNLDEWFKVELTYSSNAIEGNILTRIETAEVIERGIDVIIPGKPLKDLLEARNHAQAIEFVKALAKRTKSHQFIKEQDIKDIHKIILTGIDESNTGRYRQTEVFIKGSNTNFPLPQAVPNAMQKFIQWLQELQEVHPVQVAADAHFKFVSIHPFADGNGRTARLLMNLILLINSYPMAVIRNEERIRYLESFDFVRNKKDMQPFYNIIEMAVERSLDAYLNAAQGKPVMLHLKPKPSKTDKLLRIGELARLTGETIHTLRYWLEEGLLVVKDHTGGGYQLFEPSMVDQVREIRRLQNVERLTLHEIKRRLSHPPAG